VAHSAAMTGERSPARYLLGVDTGGTFTDAVLFDEMSRTVVRSAKAATTHGDLASGISAALDAVLTDGPVTPAAIDLVSLSTTLATNALVEKAGRPAALVAIGFEIADLDRAGLPEARGDDRVIHIAGGHDSHGVEVTPVDLGDLAAQLDSLDPAVEALAVTSQFSVRNPAHENAARDLIATATGLPVTCSHELSARLNGPRRAVTALLNARLIALTSRLLETLGGVVADVGITAPLMVVRGDGSLVSADFVLGRPIETILSGPAASLVGAAELSGCSDAVVADIGGTTTDIAVIQDGQPLRTGAGAVVGGHHTMVDAVDMRTIGLGGDSEVRIDETASAPLVVGPRRVVPLVTSAAEHPDVLRTLEAQLRDEVPRDTDGQFVMAVRSTSEPRDPAELRLLEAIGAGGVIVPVAGLDRSARSRTALSRLIASGLVRRSAFTPTDAAVSLGLHDIGESRAADIGAELMARRKDRFGERIAASPSEAARLVIDLVERRSAEAVLTVLFDHDQIPEREVIGAISSRVLDARAQGARVPTGLVELSVASTRPIVAVGASSATYYPAVGRLLDCEIVVPDHAAVANAVGAVAGRVRIEHSVVVSAPRRGLYRLHAGTEPETYYDFAEARAAAETRARTWVADDLEAAGSDDHETSVEWTEERVEIEGRELFVEGRLTVVGVGRPRLR